MPVMCGRERANSVAAVVSRTKRGYAPPMLLTACCCRPFCPQALRVAALPCDCQARAARAAARVMKDIVWCLLLCAM